MKRILTNWWFVSGVVALCAVLLLCWGLPIFVGFLDPWWVRLLLFLLVAGIWGLLAFLRIRRAKKASDAIAEELAKSADGAESRVLAERMSEALKTLRTAAGSKRGDYLYSRPWYVIIGPPGAGKTTALVNSGLRFPYSSDTFRGVGGTRNLDFLFADEAVLVDTAGRYTSQDSDSSSDAKGWQSFLGLLRKHRPLQPINGVIVAIGADELIAGDRARIDQHATTVRRRLAELRRSLETEVPVYVLVTKADLLSGFVEYYEDLDVEGRRAVLGQTFPFAAGKPGTDRMAAAFDAMAQAVERRQATRLANEKDAPRGALIMGFPSQVAQLRARLLRFLEGVFVAGDTPVGTLRGFYLTSGVQQGTPLDRIVSSMAEVYDQARQPVMGAGGTGRAYFLNRLLADVMFPEAGLIRLDPKARKRQQFQLSAAMGVIAGVSLLTLIAWGVSFANNRSFQGDLIDKSTAAQRVQQTSGIDMVEVRESDPGLEQSLDLLGALRALPRGYEERLKGTPIAMRFGLYQSGLSFQAEEAYRDALRRVLLPRLLLQLEAQMRANQSNGFAVYEPLKVYLMLGGQHGVDAKAVRSWAKAYWEAEGFPGSDKANVRQELGKHLDALLSDPDLLASWPNRQPPVDGALIASARAAIVQLSPAERAYAIMKQKALANDSGGWRAGTVLAGGDSAAFADGAAVLEASVPGFFTRQGYETVYLRGLATVRKDLENELWVFGPDAQTTSVRTQISQAGGGVAQLYARDYIEAWEAVIARMQPRDYFNDGAALNAVTRTPSPVKLLLLEVRKNTNFAGGSRAVATLATEKIKSRVGNLRTLATDGTGIDAGRTIETYFKPIHDYVGDGKSDGRLDEFLQTLKAAATAVMSAKATGGGLGREAMQTQMQSAMGPLNVAGEGAPELLKPFVNSVTGGGNAARNSTATGAVSEVYAKDVLPRCKEAIQDRYPFFSGSATDVTVVDLQRVFGLGGTIGQFVDQVRPLLETGGPVWRWREDDPVAAALDPASPDSFAKAEQISELVSGGLQLRIKLERTGGGVDQVQFGAGDANLAMAPGDVDARPIRWSAQGGAPAASIKLFRAGQPVRSFSEEGIWALFRLIDGATRRENSGPTSFLATFGDASGSATLRFSLPDERNPFSRGGMWTFRCPLKL